MTVGHTVVENVSQNIWFSHRSAELIIDEVLFKLEEERFVFQLGETYDIRNVQFLGLIYMLKKSGGDPNWMSVKSFCSGAFCSSFKV